MLRIIILARLLYSLLGGHQFEDNAACWENLNRVDKQQYACTFEINGKSILLAQYFEGEMP